MQEVIALEAVRVGLRGIVLISFRVGIGKHVFVHTVTLVTVCTN